MSRRRKPDDDDSAMDLDEVDSGSSGDIESSFHEVGDEEPSVDSQEGEDQRVSKKRTREALLTQPSSKNTKKEEHDEKEERKRLRRGREFPSIPYFDVNFKSAKYVQNSSRGRGFRWPSVQRVYADEGYTQNPASSIPNHLSLSAGRSMRPAGHYCDVTGFPSPYLDPRTRLRYASPAVFQHIRSPQFTSEGKAAKLLELRGSMTALV